MEQGRGQVVALLSQDPELVARAGDAVAAAGLRLEVCDAGTPDQWGQATALLVGEDALERMHRTGLPRSREAVLVGLDGREGQLWRAAGELPVAGVVGLPSGGAWLVHWLQGTPRAGDTANGVVTALYSAAGGVGCSTLAAAVAVTASRAGLRPLLIDAHPGPAGVDLLLGEPDAADHWSRFAGYRGHLAPQELAPLPVLEGVRCLGWGGARQVPLWQSALSSVVAAGRHQHDVVVLDAGLDAAASVELPRLTRAALLVPGTWRGILAARFRLESLAGAFDETPVIVLRDVGGRADPRSWEREFADHRVVHLGFDAGVIDDEDQGRPPGSRGRSAVARCARQLLAAVADRSAAA